jgi:hypothetical protein
VADRAAGGGVRHVAADRAAEGVLAFGSLTQRVLQRSACPATVAARGGPGRRGQRAASTPRDHR